MLRRIAGSKKRVLISPDIAVWDAALENNGNGSHDHHYPCPRVRHEIDSRVSKDVGGKPPEHAAPVQAASETGSDMLQMISRMIYSGSYALAYGAVYAAVFVAQSLPQENPVMHGFRDGGGAAMDELNGN